MEGIGQPQRWLLMRGCSLAGVCLRCLSQWKYFLLQVSPTMQCGGLDGFRSLAQVIAGMAEAAAEGTQRARHSGRSRRELRILLVGLMLALCVVLSPLASLSDLRLLVAGVVSVSAASRLRRLACVAGALSLDAPETLVGVTRRRATAPQRAVVVLLRASGERGRRRETRATDCRQIRTRWTIRRRHSLLPLPLSGSQLTRCSVVAVCVARRLCLQHLCDLRQCGREGRQRPHTKRRRRRRRQKLARTHTHTRQNSTSDQHGQTGQRSLESRLLCVLSACATWRSSSAACTSAAGNAWAASLH